MKKTCEREGCTSEQSTYGHLYGLCQKHKKEFLAQLKEDKLSERTDDYQIFDANGVERMPNAPLGIKLEEFSRMMRKEFYCEVEIQ